LSSNVNKIKQCSILNEDENYEAVPIDKPIRKPPAVNNVFIAMYTLRQVKRSWQPSSTIFWRLYSNRGTSILILLTNYIVDTILCVPVNTQIGYVQYGRILQEFVSY
jgi:hypothetical protein